MKISLLAAGAVLAVTAGAAADVKMDFGPGGVFLGGDSLSLTTVLYGEFTGMSVDFDYEGFGSDNWAADAALVFNGIQFGGYDLYLSTASSYAGALSTQNNNNPGHIHVDIAGSILMDGYALKLEFGNGYSFGNAGYYNISVTLFGVSKVPAPGAAALLGLAGLVGSRRRRA
jgi:MYXO-CTERM domain-containing protein